MADRRVRSPVLSILGLFLVVVVISRGNEMTGLPVVEEWLALANWHAHAPGLESNFASTIMMGGEVATTEFETEGLSNTYSFYTFFQ